MSDNDKTAIWYRDAVAAFDRNNLHKFIPLRTMALTQQLNAVFRLSLYYSVIMVLLTRSPKHFTVALVVAVLTAAIYELSTNERFTAVVAAPGRIHPRHRGEPCARVTWSTSARPFFTAPELRSESCQSPRLTVCGHVVVLGADVHPPLRRPFV